MQVMPRLLRAFLRWFRLGGSWGRRAKASSESGEGGKVRGRDRQILFTSHIPGAVLKR